MQRLMICLVLCFGLCLADLTFSWSQDGPSEPSGQPLSYDTAQTIGRIESKRLVECWGMDTSLIDANLLWAVNDSGNGPFLFALGRNGHDRGRVKVVGTANRDWEGLATFIWHGRPMLLIADYRTASSPRLP